MVRITPGALDGSVIASGLSTVGMPQAEIPLALLIGLGVLVAIGASFSASVMAPRSVLTGLVHGLQNGSAFGAGGSELVVVAGVAAAVLVLTLLVAARAALPRVGWARIAVRVGGSWIAALGMLMLGWLLHGTA